MIGLREDIQITDTPPEDSVRGLWNDRQLQRPLSLSFATQGRRHLGT